MNGSILARLEKLESAMGDMKREELTIFIRGVRAENGKPAAIQPEPIGAKLMGRDWALNRWPDESEDEFIERAKAVVPRGDGGVAVILMTYPDDALLDESRRG